MPPHRLALLLLHNLLELLQHPLVQGIQFQACLILCVGVVGWTLSGVRRRRERLRLQEAGYTALLQERIAFCAGMATPYSSPAVTTATAAKRRLQASTKQQQEQAKDTQQPSCSTAGVFKSVRPLIGPTTANSNPSTSNVGVSGADADAGVASAAWPPLAVVLPVKGCRPHSCDNWASQLQSHYDGPCVFVFVVESAADPAVAAVTGLLQQQHQQMQVADTAMPMWTQLLARDSSSGSNETKRQQAPAAAALRLCDFLPALLTSRLLQPDSQKTAGQQQQKQQQQQVLDCDAAGVLGVWRQQQQRQHGAGGDVRLVVIAQAGQATTCSQKIHNILHGIEVTKPLLQHWHNKQPQQQPKPTDSLKQQQQQQQKPGSVSRNSSGGAGGQQVFVRSSSTQQACVQILAVAGGSSTDGSSNNSTRDGSTSDEQPPSAAAAAVGGSVGTTTGSSSDSSDSEGYVCVLDDDVLLHPFSLMQLADELQADPRLFMTTGYPFDIVATAQTTGSSSSSSRTGVLSAAWGRLLSYAAASYHLPLTIGFSIADRGAFVWGGAVMMRAAALVDNPPLHLWQSEDRQQQQQQNVDREQGKERQPDRQQGKKEEGKKEEGKKEQVPNILQVWREGGYSDDLLLAAYCVENGLSIGMPASAVYPQLLPAATSFKQYWNYLRRQLFVLDTYYSPTNRTTNHTMMVLHSYGSFTFTIAAVAAVLQLLALAALAAAAAGCCCCCRLLVPGGDGVAVETAAGGWGLGLQDAFGGRVLGAGIQTLTQGAAWTCQQVCSDTGSSSSGSGSSIAGVWLLQSALSPGLCAFVVCIAAAQCSVWFLFDQALMLMRLLSPPPPCVVSGTACSISDATDQHTGQQQHQQHVTVAPPPVQQLLHRPQMSYSLLWTGWVFENALLPTCMAYTYACDWISWGGIWYRKGGGKVVEVVHPPRPAASGVAVGGA